MRDARQHERRELELQAQIRAATALDYAVARCCNLSMGGLFVELDRPAERGTLVKVLCEVAGVGAFSGVGVVAWQRSRGDGTAPGVGIRFMRLDPGSAGVVAGMLGERAPGTPGSARQLADRLNRRRRKVYMGPSPAHEAQPSNPGVAPLPDPPPPAGTKPPGRAGARDGEIRAPGPGLEELTAGPPGQAPHIPRRRAPAVLAALALVVAVACAVVVAASFGTRSDTADHAVAPAVVPESHPVLLRDERPAVEPALPRGVGAPEEAAPDQFGGEPVESGETEAEKAEKAEGGLPAAAQALQPLAQAPDGPGGASAPAAASTTAAAALQERARVRRARRARKNKPRPDLAVPVHDALPRPMSSGDGEAAPPPQGERAPADAQEQPGPPPAPTLAPAEPASPAPPAPEEP